MWALVHTNLNNFNRCCVTSLYCKVVATVCGYRLLFTFWISDRTTNLSRVKISPVSQVEFISTSIFGIFFTVSNDII